MENSLNALVVGCGSLYGKTLSEQLQNNGYTVYGISGSQTDNANVLQVNWKTCAIQDFEKFLRKLPTLNLIVFNQNSTALIDEYTKLDSVHIFEIWKRSQDWNQSHYVNCVLPVHVLQTLSTTKKIVNDCRVAWVLSRAMFGEHTIDPIDYVGQKYQNYVTMKNMATKNPQIFVGICPGKLDEHNRNIKASILTDFLMTVDKDHSGKFFVIDNDSVIPHQSH